MMGLVVEDDSFKLEAIRATLAPVADLQIAVAKSLRAAMTKLEEATFDFVILDMAIPSHTSDAGAVDTYSQPVGGLDVLLYLVSQSRPEQVVILTQHPTVEYNRRHVPLKDMVGTLRLDGIENVSHVILFTEAGDWKVPLLSMLASIN